MLLNTRLCKQHVSFSVHPTLNPRVPGKRGIKLTQYNQTQHRSAPSALLDKLLGVAGNLKPNKISPAVRTARNKLLDALVNGTSDQAEISNLVDQLAACQLPFKEELLGGGPWVVVFTKGRLQLWNATYKSGRLFNPKNQASQDLDPRDCTVINKAEYGTSLYVTASGYYEPLDDSRITPKAIRANIQSGNLHVFGLDIPLPIRGSGTFEVCYLDDTMRIFRSNGSYAVQVKLTKLQTN